MKFLFARFKEYRDIYALHGLSGVSRKLGRPATIGLILFFLGKGLFYIALLYLGGMQWLGK